MIPGALAPVVLGNLLKGGHLSARRRYGPAGPLNGLHR